MSSDFLSKPVNLRRHEAECKVCLHERREEIERDFLNWGNTVAIVKEYGIQNRSSIYRHAHALGLFPKRQRNVRAALEKIIEKAGDVEVTATAVVSAVGAYARINAAGQWIERTEKIDLNDLFERMSREELKAYVEGGTLPEWFTSLTEKAATAKDGEEDTNVS